MKDIKSALKVVTTSVAVAAVSAPLVLAAPAAADIDTAQSRIAFLRGLVEAKSDVASQHPILRNIVAAAQSEDPSAQFAAVHTNAHTNGHTNGHTNKIGTQVPDKTVIG